MLEFDFKNAVGTLYHTQLLVFVGNVQKAEKSQHIYNDFELIFSRLCFVLFLQNFKSHMNSVSHQQRMMEIQHMSNACLVTLLPRVQESLQEANKDGSV